MPARPLAARPHKRKGHWYLLRRVPEKFAHLDPRGVVRISTGIRIPDDPLGIRAAREVQRIDEALQQYWLDLAAGKSAAAMERFEKAVDTARRLGFVYVPVMDALKKLTPEDIYSRIEYLASGNRTQIEPTVTAVLGGAERPALRLSGLLDEYKRVQSVELAGKSEAQLDRWLVNRKTAVENFIASTGGDRALADLLPAHIIPYRDALRTRVASGEISADTANKAIGRVGSMFRAVNDDMRLGLDDIFSKMRVGTSKYKKRPAYAVEFIQGSLLASGALDSLNEEARRVLYLMVETGLRPSEACSLKAEHIHLDANVPYVEVVADGREIKTDSSARKIPLVGVSLMAMRAQPNGFPRYWDKGNSLSAVVNKALKVAELCPDGTSLYSLRHSFEDRLMAAKAPENVIADMMGHERARPRYGDGLSLLLKSEWLTGMALTPPDRV